MIPEQLHCIQVVHVVKNNVINRVHVHVPIIRCLLICMIPLCSDQFPLLPCNSMPSHCHRKYTTININHLLFLFLASHRPNCRYSRSQIPSRRPMYFGRLTPFTASSALRVSTTHSPPSGKLLNVVQHSLTVSYQTTCTVNIEHIDRGWSMSCLIKVC